MKMIKVLMAVSISSAMAFSLTPAMAGSCSSKSYDGASASKASAVTSHAEMSQDLVDVAVGAGSFETLVAAVKAAGLVDVLKSKGPYTVFAPTDEAFAKLPEGTVEALLQDKDKLASILTYHVVPGKLMAADVTGLSKAKTVQGQDIRIQTGKGVMVNQANVIQTDIAASNGVIHVIDSVILPN